MTTRLATRPAPARAGITAPRAEPASTLRLVLSFAAVYVIWGSTYLAIRYAIETMPPFLMAGARFTVAGTLLYGWLRLRGAPRPRPGDWGSATVVGGLMLVGGNGALSWAESRVPSGIASLLIATVPIWIVVLERLRPNGERPGGAVVAGLGLGTLGVGLLVGPHGLLAGKPIDPLGAAVLLLGSFLWAVGSLRSRGGAIAGPPLLTTGMVMLSGGAELLLLGLISGETARLETAEVTLRSGLALLYLVVFGSIVAYSAYLWLMRHAPPARVATYAYVNPMIALLLGFTFAGEPLSARTLGAASLIIASVAILQLGKSRSTRGGRP